MSILYPIQSYNTYPTPTYKAWGTDTLVPSLSAGVLITGTVVETWVGVAGVNVLLTQCPTVRIDTLADIAAFLTDTRPTVQTRIADTLVYHYVTELPGKTFRTQTPGI